MERQKKGKGDRPVAGAERTLERDAQVDREYTTPDRARDASQPMEPPEGKDPPARRGEDDRGRPLEREADRGGEPSGE